MSSKKVNISELSSEKLAELKATTVYERLKSAYGISSDEKLGKRLAGISKQAIRKRKKSGNYDPDEILREFPDVNREWIFSDDYENLRKLPVRDSLNGAEVQYAGEVESPKGGLSKKHARQLLSQIEEIVKILKDSL